MAGIRRVLLARRRPANRNPGSNRTGRNERDGQYLRLDLLALSRHGSLAWHAHTAGLAD
jgi:hypothetical protein